MKYPFLLLVVAAACAPALALERAAADYWKGGVVRQDTVDMKDYGKGVIRARVENKWREFRTRKLPARFLDWNFAGRLEYIALLRKPGARPPLAGPHSGMVASHGRRRDGSQFTINNAVKGIGFVPVREKLPAMLKLLSDTRGEPMPRRLDILEDLYTKRRADFDAAKLISLELYSSPSFATHTFLNEMSDPGVSIVFLDIPSFEVRAIARLLDPRDGKLSEYDRQTAEWCNAIHEYFHGGGDKKYIAAVYHVIEVFDNTPGKKGLEAER